jgi:hypothetical protein
MIKHVIHVSVKEISFQIVDSSIVIVRVEPYKAFIEEYVRRFKCQH